jgi:predicted amidohydrolase
MASTLDIGIVQFDISWEDPEANFEHIAQMLNEHLTLDLLLLPEMWPTGFSMRPEALAEEAPGRSLSWMVEHSQKFNLAIAGSIPVREGNTYYNRFYFVNTDGVIHYYNKRHLFSYGKEDQHYTAGTERVIINYKGWKIMPVVCYDLRFPVWCRNDVGYDLMLVVANWPSPRIHHWDALLKGRAIENQSYIAASNRIGTDGNGLQYSGHSCIVDMNGNYLLEMDDREGIEMATLDKEELIRHRDQYRFLQDQDKFEIKP